MKRIAIYCASSSGTGDAFIEAARQVGTVLASRDIGIVYGGSSIGLMGALADAALAEGGEVIGVLPDFMQQREIGHDGITQLHIVSSMHERKAKMAELAEGFIALPGGLGTLEEVFEMLTWTQLHLQDKPVGFLNINGFYSDLFRFLDSACEAGLLKPANRDLALRSEWLDDLLDQMEQWQPVSTDKWTIENRT